MGFVFDWLGEGASSLVGLEMVVSGVDLEGISGVLRFCTCVEVG